MGYQSTEFKCKVLYFISQFSFSEVISLPDSGAGNALSTLRGTSVLLIGAIEILPIQSQFHIIPIILCLHLEVGLNDYTPIYKTFQPHHYAHSAYMTVQSALQNSVIFLLLFKKYFLYF